MLPFWCCCSFSKSCLIICNPMDCSMPGFSFFYNHPEFPQIHVHSISDHFILWNPILFLPLSFPASGSFLESILHIRWSKYWGLGFKYPMNIQGWFPLGWTGLISFQFKRVSRVFCKHNLKAAVLWCSAFFMVQLSHPYMTTGKTRDEVYGPLSARWCLCFLNIISRFVIAFLPRSKHLLN